MAYEDWASHIEPSDNLPIIKPTNEFILSNKKIINKAALEDQGLNPTTAILCLAATGLNLILPNVSFDLIAQEEIEKIKSTLIEERIEYLIAITKIADETHERLKSGNIKDILSWAQNETHYKIIPKARLLESNTRKISKSELKKSGFAFWKEKTPIIGKAYFEKGALGASKVAAEEILKTILPIMLKNRENRNLPEVAYALRISEAAEI